jgi:S-adenosylmethionine-dependent methyltransferase
MASAVIERARTSYRTWRQLGQDADFDELGSSFESIYDSSWGSLRLAVLWEDLLANIPRLRAGGARVLDAGGGAGRIATRIAQLGNEVVLCDPSPQMLERAKTAIEAAQLMDAITLVQAPIQDLDVALGDTFDVITCHAVLEWLAEPRAVLARVVAALEPDGQLSLMFANRNAHLFKRILSGDLAGVLSDADSEATRPPHAEQMRLRRFIRLPSGWSRRAWGHTPAPLSEDVVRSWLESLGFVVQSKAGIRIFHDYVPEDARTERLDELEALEKIYRSTEPFASLGQHAHLVCTRARA